MAIFAIIALLNYAVFAALAFSAGEYLLPLIPIGVIVGICLVGVALEAIGKVFRKEPTNS